MNINNVTSQLKYIGSTVKQLYIDNHLISIEDDSKKEIDMELVPISYSSNSIKHIATIALKMNITITTNGDICKITLLLEGEFSSSINLDEEEFKKICILNGGATLYSIARGKLEAVTALTFSRGKISLPMINMVDYVHDKMKE